MSDVLVVDDHSDIADSLAAILRLWGHSVRVAYNGIAAIDEASNAKLRVIVLDIGMPGMNGYEVARRIRERCGSSVRLVAHTAWTDSRHKACAEEVGFDLFLVKPAMPADLLRAVEV